jgi:peptidoglycan/xylan/chitin deacetylase (PgdA/CDA1 family)
MLRVLTYHRVAELKDSLTLNPRMISATPANFVRQMRYLAKNYHVISMAEVVHAAEKRVRLPRRAVLITFDDAYCDFGEIAWPVLKRFRLPATLFVPTAYPDQPDRSFWWDRLYRAFAYTSRAELKATSLGVLSLVNSETRRQSLRRLQNFVKTIAHAEAMVLVDEICAGLDERPIAQKSVLSWKELRQLAKEGVTICAHTRTHPIMTQLSSEEIRQEISGSRRDLQQEIGEILPIFCYPSGSHDDTVVNILKEEGFTVAFTTLDGHNDMRSADLLRLRRTNLTRRTSLPIFRLRLLRVGACLDTWRH